VVFLDDLNMPARSKFGFMPPLELLKLWADNGFWWVGRCWLPPRSAGGPKLLWGVQAQC
jgi:hypothetical protein